MTEPNTLDELEQKLLNDKSFQHILKFAPQSQRELMTFELAKYFQALFTEHSKEVDRLARQDQTFKVVQTLVKSGSISDMVASSTLSLLTAQLKRNK